MSKKLPLSMRRGFRLAFFTLVSHASLLANETDLSAPDGSKGGGTRPPISISLPVPSIKVEEVRTATNDDAHYLGWPSLAIRRNGDLLLTYSGGRDYHVCPFGRIELMQSTDNGRTWSQPRIILDTDLDDRGQSIIETGKGTLLLGYISSKVYQRHMNNPERLLNKVFGDKAPEHLARWHAQDQKTTPEEKREIAGEYDGRMLIRSTDDGKTWSEPMPVPFFSPREPALLSNGDILYVAGDGKQGGAYLSQDDGLTWQHLSWLPTTAGEAHCVEAADGSIVAHVREKEPTPAGTLQYTTQTKSRDGGKTWSEPRKVTDGYPSHLLRLDDGTLLMTYGVRKAPFGIRGRISQDHGDSWSEEFFVTDDAASWDLGYPCTAQLKDGRLLTVWYEVPEGRKNAVIRQAVWKLN